MIMAMTIDKQNGDICFNEDAHVYFNIKDPKKKYISVTTLIHKFEPPFDKDFWSAYKAIEQLVEPDYWRQIRKELLATKSYTPKLLAGYDINIDDFNAVQQNILDGWQKENLASTQRGSKIHSDLEHSFYAQKTDISLQKYGLGGRFVCVEGKTELDLENGVYPEYLIYYESPDGKLSLAGQIDLLVKEGNSFSIIDWKGLPLDTKIPTINGWTTMGEIKVGDKVFDRDGNPCAVIHKSEVHHNPCYRIAFTNGDNIVADEDHRWLISLLPEIERTRLVMTTKELAKYLTLHPEAELIIEDAKPLELQDKVLEAAFPMTDEGIAARIQQVLRASKEQRLALTTLLCKKCVSADTDRHIYVAKKTKYTALFKELLTTFGIHVSDTDKGGLEFYTSRIPYLKELAEWENSLSNHPEYRTIKEVTPVETVPTQCIEVDSITHTFLCTEMLLVTHNTNKQIKQSSYFNQKTKTSEKLKYPLNDLDNCNYSTYNMQLSTYAWMIQQIHPDWICKDLVLVHFDHNNNMTTYKMEYLKTQVEKMIAFWKKESVLEEHRAKRKRIEY